ncbi:hypothetical protein [Mycoplasma todarodis]|uniref:hypothetical protein n=1 Tax=Mycoplasma todarodis TaxID=1937191 RepID=UPI003B50A315
MKNKLTLGALSVLTIAAPIAIVISCGDTTTSNKKAKPETKTEAGSKDETKKETNKGANKGATIKPIDNDLIKILSKDKIIDINLDKYNTPEKLIPELKTIIKKYTDAATGKRSKHLVFHYKSNRWLITINDIKEEMIVVLDSLTKTITGSVQKII